MKLIYLRTTVKGDSRTCEFCFVEIQSHSWTCNSQVLTPLTSVVLVRLLQRCAGGKDGKTDQICFLSNCYLWNHWAFSGSRTSVLGPGGPALRSTVINLSAWGQLGHYAECVWHLNRPFPVGGSIAIYLVHNSQLQPNTRANNLSLAISWSLSTSALSLSLFLSSHGPGCYRLSAMGTDDTQQRSSLSFLFFSLSRGSLFTVVNRPDL